MPRTLNRLKPLAVERIKSPGRYADGGGLYLIVKPGPRKSWAFIYRRGAKMTELGLGGVSDVPLTTARKRRPSCDWFSSSTAIRRLTESVSVKPRPSRMRGPSPSRPRLAVS